MRPTVYTPYDRIEADMTLEEVGGFNRQMFVEDIYSGEQKDLLYKLLFGNHADRATKS